MNEPHTSELNSRISLIGASAASPTLVVKWKIVYIYMFVWYMRIPDQLLLARLSHEPAWQPLLPHHFSGQNYWWSEV